ncbi:MAG: N-acetylmuramoyl-L-alanine amidase [Acidimicrobiales bacterium]
MAGSLLIVLVASACGSSTEDPIPKAAAATPSTVSQPPSTTLLGDIEFDSTDGDAEPLVPLRTAALITTTGVPVSVLGQSGERMVVRTPCGGIDFVSGGTQLRAVDVVLDPGHGGPIATGAVGPNGLVESVLNLRVAESALAEMALRGITATSTRSGDYATTLTVRAAFADNLRARLMVSIHHNAPNGAPSSSPGTEVYVQSGSMDSSRLGGLLQSYVSSALGGLEDIRWSAAGDAGVLRVLNSQGADAYSMVRRPETTTALVELGYISNSDEATLFATEEYAVVAGAALADAVEAFLNSAEPGSGFVGEPRIFNPRSAPGADVCVDPDLE